MNARVSGAAAALVAMAALAGCAGQQKQLQMRDGAGVKTEVLFPKGDMLGGVSQEQICTLADMVAKSNTATEQRLDAQDQTAAQTAATAARIETKAQQIETKTQEVQATAKRVEETATQIAETDKRIETATRSIAETEQRVDATTKKTQETTARVDETTKRTEDSVAKTYDTTKMILEAFEKVSKKQGTGELTIFFPVASSRIEKGSLEYQRLVTFVDFLARESRGRKIMLVSVGSASAFGTKEVNERLAKERSQAPLEVVDQYLVNLPHEYVKIYGTGDTYSPKDVTRKEHDRYQATRLIAFYERDQQPQLPAETQPAPGRVSQR